MGFEFRFETVLNQRDWKQKKAEKDLAEVQTLICRERACLDNLTRALTGAREELRHKTRVEEVMLYCTFLEDLKKEIARQEGRIAQLLELDAQKRNLLMKAAGEKKVMETLKEKDLGLFRRRLQKEEERFLDELCMIAENQKAHR